MATYRFEARLKLVSPNVQEHWAKKHQRSIVQKSSILMEWLRHHRPKISTPCTVTLIRYGVRQFDSDNLQSSFKTIRDTVADIIKPGHAPGQADSDKSITWQYQQASAKNPSVVIEIVEE